MIVSSSVGPAGIVGGGSECTALSSPSKPRRGALEQGTEHPTAPRAPQHKWLNSVCSRCVCVHCCVCVHFGWVKCRAQIQGHHTWLYVTSLSLSLLHITVFFDQINSVFVSIRYFFQKHIHIYQLYTFKQ